MTDKEKKMKKSQTKKSKKKKKTCMGWWWEGSKRNTRIWKAKFLEFIELGGCGILTVSDKMFEKWVVLFVVLSVVNL